MDNTFNLEVVYKGEIHSFDARLSISGYSHRFFVDIDGTEVTFEPDEEGRYRAVIYGETAGSGQRQPEPALLMVLGEKIEQIFS